MKEPNRLRCKRCGRRTGVPVSERALGTGLFGKTWGDAGGLDEVRSILPGAVEAGGTRIHTAESAQHGAVETRISACVAPNRSDLPSLRRTGAVPWCIQRWPCSTTAARQGCSRSPLIIDSHAHTTEDHRSGQGGEDARHARCPNQRPGVQQW
jgi:hypothetical protein